MERQEDATALGCPNCGGVALWSDEPASIMYGVRFTRAANGTVDMEYDGIGYDPQDEGAVYVGDIWCRSCGSQLTEDRLVEVS
ncbi:MAG: hypothetical protein ACXVGN_00025 [Mycobacteriaceae bacterium]